MDYVKKQIQDIEDIIKNGRGDNIFNYLTVLDILRDDYEKVGEKEKLKNLLSEEEYKADTESS